MNPIAQEMMSYYTGNDSESEEIAHYGVKGMKWGIRRTPEQLGHDRIFRRSNGGTYNSNDVVFISGKIKFDEPVTDMIKQELNRVVASKSKIVIGDAPGADTRVQDYLHEIGYKNVTVYTTDEQVRNNVGNWKVKKISGNGKMTEREVRREKDIAMSNVATKGIAISSDDDDADSAMSLNVQRLIDSGKSVHFYDFKKDILSENDVTDVKHSMNPVAQEMMSYLGSAEDPDFIEHYGMPRRSGRYPWGSGEDPYQHSQSFLSRVEEMRAQGVTYTDKNGHTYTGDTAIAKTLGLSTTEFRTELGIAKNEQRMVDVAKVKTLMEDNPGITVSEIGRRMGKNESSIRSLLNEKSEERMGKAQTIADFIKKQVDEKGIVDIGAGVEKELGVSSVDLNKAVYLLKREGYLQYGGRTAQVTNAGQMTTIKTLCKPGTEHKEIFDTSKIHSLNDYTSHDGGETFDTFVYPKSMDSKRLKIRYDEDGGTERDGLIEIRRGCKDLSLGDAHYAQVRILVDDKKYLKGMAVYSDDLPDGVDVVFNTNKSRSVGMDALKNIKTDDPKNPFGSLIKANGQSYYTDENGKRQLSLINKRAEEGDWSDWKDTIPSQFLAKQPIALIERQLKQSKETKAAEFEDIMSITNPTVKKHFLQSFADDCDSTAVHLKAAALPGQKYHVIIPINTLKDNEVYAPNYENGTKLALVRYPHGGIFEIPILTVNNKNADAKRMLGEDVGDAIGINKKNADKLSGADFDGDTVMTIPTHRSGSKVKISARDSLPGLEGFDPKAEYPEREGMRYMTKKNTQKEMGVISNLIMDMTLKGATDPELAAAVRHSMVVIDAEKHKLDYKKSEIDNNIAALKKKYQMRVDEDGKVHYGGASTLLTRAKSDYSVDKRQGTPKINVKDKPWYDPNKPEGSLIYKTSDNLEYTVKKVNKRTGEETVEVRTRKQQSTKMAETDDAYSLVSEKNTPQERAYADYANYMKSLANTARKELMSAGKINFSAEAKKEYQEEVSSLMAKLNTAEKNAPRERLAQFKANAEIAKLKENGPIEKSELKKASQRALSNARSQVGSVSRKDRSIKIEDREWEAIQKGAISENILIRILKNTDADNLRERATPKTANTLTQTQMNRIKTLSANDYTLAEIANQLHCSTSTVYKYLKGTK